MNNNNQYPYYPSNGNNTIPSYPMNAQVNTNAIPSYPVQNQHYTTTHQYTTTPQTYTNTTSYPTNNVVYQDPATTQAAHDHRVKRDVGVGAAVGLGVLAPITIPFLAAGALLHHAGKRKGQAQGYNGQN